MKGIVAAFAVGLAVGIAVPLVGPQSRAHGEPEPVKAEWEYQVAYEPSAVFIDRRGAFENAATNLTRDYNQMAAGGWEYVRTVMEHYEQGRTQGAFVLFRRPRK